MATSRKSMMKAGMLRKKLAGDFRRMTKQIRTNRIRKLPQLGSAFIPKITLLATRSAQSARLSSERPTKSASR